MPKIYDCFTFFNELDLLEMRLKMLSSVVDYFVIVECAKTQTGVDKPFYFEENKERYSQWKDKIIHVKVNDVQDISHDVVEDWSIENHQRNCIFRGLVNARPDDIIMVSDLDEFPNPYLLTHLDEYIVKENPVIIRFKAKVKKAIKIMLGKYREAPTVKLSEAIEKYPVSLEQKFFYYFMNCQNLNNWRGTIMLKFKAFQLPQVLRDGRFVHPYVPLYCAGGDDKSAGWHFSYLGGKERILKKLNSIIEGHLINDIKLPENMTTEQYIDYCLENGLDIFQRPEEKFKFIKLDEIGIPNAKEYAEEYPQFFNVKTGI